MYEAKKRSVKSKPTYTIKKEIRLTKEEIKKQPRQMNGGYVWAG